MIIGISGINSFINSGARNHTINVIKVINNCDIYYFNTSIYIKLYKKEIRNRMKYLNDNYIKSIFNFKQTIKFAPKNAAYP